MPMDDALSGSQSYSGAFKLFGAMQTLKHPEELIYILHVKSRSVVPYKYLYLTFLTPVTANLDFSPALQPCELNRIGNQIYKDNFQHRTVAVTHWERPDFPINVSAVRLLPKLRDDLSDKLLQVHCGLFGLGPPDPRESQEVVDQVTHSFRRLENSLHEPTALVIERRRCLSLQQLRVANNMAKWRAQVVGDGIGKRFLFLVASFAIRSLSGEFPIELADFVFSVRALFQFDLKPVARLTETVLDTVPSSAKPGND